MATLKFNVKVVGTIVRKEEGQPDRYTTVLRTAKYKNAIMWEGNVLYPYGAKLKLVQRDGQPDMLQER